MIERGLYQLVSAALEQEAERLLEAVTDVVWRTLYDGYRGGSLRR
jgi:prophage antirepressor-like protein